MPPETKSSQTVERGPAGPQELAAGDIALRQASQSLDLFGQATTDPRLLAGTIDARIQEKEVAIQRAKDRLAFLEAPYAQYGTGPNFTNQEEQVATAQSQLDSATAALRGLQAQKAIVPEQLKEYESTQRVRNLATSRLEDFLAGRDIGVSAEERALITQGISGISQDVATTRGLNRSDVPVMQAVAPAVSQALLAQTLRPTSPASTAACAPATSLAARSRGTERWIT